MELLKDKPPYIRFVQEAIEDKAATLKAGTYIAKDVDFVHVTPHYTKDIFKQKAQDWLSQMDSDAKAGRIPPEWAEQFRKQYQAWKAGQELPIEGTPVKGWNMISPALQETLVRMNIRTVEDLARVNDDGIRRIGMGAVDMKLKARVWLEQAKDRGPLVQEMAADKARIRELETSVKTLSDQVAALMTRQEMTPQPEEPFGIADLVEPTAAQRYEEKFGKPPHHRMKEETILKALE